MINLIYFLTGKEKTYKLYIQAQISRYTLIMFGYLFVP